MFSGFEVWDWSLMNHYIVRSVCMSKCGDCSARLRHFAVNLLACLSNYTYAIVFFVNKELSRAWSRGTTNNSTTNSRYSYWLLVCSTCLLLLTNLLLIGSCIGLTDSTKCTFHLNHTRLLYRRTVRLQSFVIENLAAGLIEFYGLRASSSAEMLRVWIKVRLGCQSNAGLRSSFHSLIGFACVRWHMEIIASRACRNHRSSLVDSVMNTLLQSIYLYLLLGVELVSKAGQATWALTITIKYERVLSIDFAVNLTWLLKVVYGQVTKNSLAAVSYTRCYSALLGHLLLVCVRISRKIGMIWSISGPIGEWLDHFLIVGVVDGWIMRLQATSGWATATNLVLDTIHSYRFTNRRRTVLLLLVMLWKWLDVTRRFLM